MRSSSFDVPYEVWFIMIPLAIVVFFVHHPPKLVRDVFAGIAEGLSGQG